MREQNIQNINSISKFYFNSVGIHRELKCLGRVQTDLLGFEKKRQP